MTNDSDPLHTPEPEGRGSIGDLVRRLLDDVRLLFRQEEAEMRRKLIEAGSSRAPRASSTPR